MNLNQIIDQNEPVARMADAASVATLGAVALGWLPHIATVMTVVWMGFRLANEIHKWRTRNERMGRRKDD